MPDKGRMLAVDPGENTGFSIWKDDRLLGGGQIPLWQFAHDLKNALEHDVGPLEQGESEILAAGVSPDDNVGKIDVIVCEKFALYPDKAKSLYWDEFRTVQLIGAITLLAQDHDILLHKQPALIKSRAMAGGAGELFIKPLHENRHQNDSIMHGWFYRQVEVKGINLKLPDKGKGS